MLFSVLFLFFFGMPAHCFSTAIINSVQVCTASFVSRVLVHYGRDLKLVFSCFKILDAGSWWSGLSSWPALPSSKYNAVLHLCGEILTSCPRSSGRIQPTSVDKGVRAFFPASELSVFCSFSTSFYTKQSSPSSPLFCREFTITLPFWSRLERAILTNSLNFTGGHWTRLRSWTCLWSHWSWHS